MLVLPFDNEVMPFAARIPMHQHPAIALASCIALQQAWCQNDTMYSGVIAW